MLGGGTFVTQNKVLAGAYINFVSVSKAPAALGERGRVAIALPLKWGVDDSIFAVTASDFQKNSLAIFGFEYTSEDAKPIRELFRNASVIYVYKLMNGGAKATNSIATAKYKGSEGAKIATEILAGTEEGTFDVNVYFGTALVYSKTVASIDELKAESNDWVDWTIDSLAASERTLLSGSNLDGSAVTVAQHTDFLTAAESYAFNAMVCASEDDAVKSLYVQAVKDSREDIGVKYQLVVFNKAADYEGVVNVKNAFDAIYWVGGAIAGCAINASLTNSVYAGEYDLPVNYSKAELESAIKKGEFTFHKVGDEVRVLEDINSLVTVTEVKGADFKSNQTIRVIDQVATDIAAIFNTRYLGKIPNDASGRISLWNDIVKHHQELESVRAIENFDPEAITVEQGESKKAVVVNDAITVVNAMTQLYMSVVIA